MTQGKNHRIIDKMFKKNAVKPLKLEISRTPRSRWSRTTSINLKWHIKACLRLHLAPEPKVKKHIERREENCTTKLYNKDIENNFAWCEVHPFWRNPVELFPCLIYSGLEMNISPVYRSIIGKVNFSASEKERTKSNIIYSDLSESSIKFSPDWKHKNFSCSYRDWTTEAGFWCRGC